MNELLATVRYGDTALYEVGLQDEDPSAWPIAVNYMLARKHGHVTPELARCLAKALLEAADECERLGLPVDEHPSMTAELILGEREEVRS